MAGIITRNAGGTVVYKSELLPDKVFFSMDKLREFVEGKRYKRLRSEMRKGMRTHVENEKLRADLKYNIDRITQSQKLDLNLEKGRLRELHGIQESQMKEVEARVDRELHQMRTQIEAAKTEIIRYSVGTLVSLGALSLAAIRLVM